MKFFCAVMLVGILVSCSLGQAHPTDMLAKVNFNTIAEEMDMRREEKRRRDETRRDDTVCVPCGVCCGVCAHVHDFHVFFHVMVVAPLTFHNVSCFLLLAAVSSIVFAC